jgi:hypothetical protein
MPLPFPETGIFLLDLLLYDPEPERKLDQWLRHLQRLDHKIRTKTDVVGARLAYVNAEVVEKQEEVDRLVDQLWQPDTFTLFEG